MSDPVQLSVKVIAPEALLYEGKVFAVSGHNEEGPFAILPGHSNFISITEKAIVLHETKQTAKEIAIQQAVVFCHNNQVEVYVASRASAPS